MEYGQPYHQPPIPGVPMVRILDENGRQCMQSGYYIHHEKANYCGAFGLDLTDEQVAENTEHIVAITDQGDWNMENTLRLIRVTPPHRIEVIEKPCDYCGYGKPFAPFVADVPAFDDCAIEIEGGKMTFYQGNDECTFRINNCPMCGRSLKKVEP